MRSDIETRAAFIIRDTAWVINMPYTNKSMLCTLCAWLNEQIIKYSHHNGDPVFSEFVDCIAIRIWQIGGT